MTTTCSICRQTITDDDLTIDNEGPRVHSACYFDGPNISPAQRRIHAAVERFVALEFGHGDDFTFCDCPGDLASAITELIDQPETADMSEAELRQHILAGLA